MRMKLTRKQKYNKEYYLSHKGEAEFEKRRSSNAKKYRAKPATKKRRNKRLREKWATDAAYRKHISEYQKAWRKKRNLAKRRGAVNSKRKVRD